MKACLLCIAVACIIMPDVAVAQNRMLQCGDRQGIISNLERRHDERLLLSGVNRRGNLIEVYGSAGPSRTFTILGTRPAPDNNMSCVYDFGTNLQVAADVKEPGEAI